MLVLAVRPQTPKHESSLCLSFCTMNDSRHSAGRQKKHCFSLNHTSSSRWYGVTRCYFDSIKTQSRGGAIPPRDRSSRPVETSKSSSETTTNQKHQATSFSEHASFISNELPEAYLRSSELTNQTQVEPKANPGGDMWAGCAFVVHGVGRDAKNGKGGFRFGDPVQPSF